MINRERPMKLRRKHYSEQNASCLHLASRLEKVHLWHILDAFSRFWCFFLQLWVLVRCSRSKYILLSFYYAFCGQFQTLAALEFLTGPEPCIWKSNCRNLMLYVKSKHKKIKLNSNIQKYQIQEIELITFNYQKCEQYLFRPKSGNLFTAPIHMLPRKFSGCSKNPILQWYVK